RFYPVDKGVIKYGNELIEDIPLRFWRQKIGYVMQSNAMMSGTIRDNLTYGINETVSDETLIHNTKMANCYDFIMKFPQGFETELGKEVQNYQVVKDRELILREVLLKIQTSCY